MQILRSILFFALTLVLVAKAAEKPNIIYIYADDLGYGDVGCYGATKIKTPNIDKLAREGIRFTDAHSTSATCTPSRYAFMTGEYPWRKKGTGILPGDAKLIIDPTRPTLPAMLKKAGYKSAAIGKWHLGLGNGPINWNREIKPGPLEIGFDYSFLIPATVDRVPCVYVENHRVVGLDPNDPIQVDYKKKIGDEPTGSDRPDLLKMKLTEGHDATIVNGISRIGFMSGGKSALWVDEEISDILTTRAIKFIEENKSRPFFLYFATHDVHVPRTPHARFKGSSECGLRGDVTQEFDWSVGEIMKTISRLRLDENTLIIVTSDNGPVLDDGYADGAVKDLNGHKPAGPLRGGKYSVYEAGTRVPFVARWPKRIKPGESAALISQVDCFATFAALAGQKLSPEAAPDSFDILPALLGNSNEAREYFVEDARVQSLRKGPWKFIAAAETAQKSAGAANRGIASGPQLYNLSDDIGETKNLAEQNPDLTKELAEKLSQFQTVNRTRP
ncbi:MAG: arylsulfatase [Verrucomicrobiota bacterium]